MGLKKIVDAGLKADNLIFVAQTLNSLHNTHKQRYAETLVTVRASLADETKALGSLTDDEINQVFFGAWRMRRRWLTRR